MTGLERVATYLPDRSVAVSEVLEDLGQAERASIYERYFGFQRIRCDPQQPLTAQLTNAVELLGLTQEELALVRYIVHAPTIAFASTYDRSVPRAVAQSLGISHATCFAVSQHGCASPFAAIDVVAGLLAEEEHREALAAGTLRGIVLAGEKTFTDEARHITNSAVMGEGAAAVLVSSAELVTDMRRDVVLGYHLRTWGEFHRAPFLNPAEQVKFEAMYVDGLVEVVTAAVRQAGLDLSEIAALAPHQVSRLSWLRVQRRLGLSPGCIVLDTQSQAGHCFGADPFLSLGAASASQRVSVGDHYVLVAAGLGVTMAAMVVRRGTSNVWGAVA